jgi:hypothetical protein
MDAYEAPTSFTLKSNNFTLTVIFLCIGLFYGVLQTTLFGVLNGLWYVGVATAFGWILVALLLQTETTCILDKASGQVRDISKFDN